MACRQIGCFRKPPFCTSTRHIFCHYGCTNLKEAKVCCSQADLVVLESDLEEWEFEKIIDQPVEEKDEEKYVETAVCGIHSPFSLLISGGEKTAPGDFPWMALLKYSDPVW